ncbi:MAG: recombinase zinc beta ribbon domain-containing protein [Lachnospiraceae bacterium]|nr:recombinase zinc beta ribbon domain-containing protein [Lachnospiraceae bacterium]
MLSGKLYCGICGEKLTATGGTSQNGKQHHYYRCKDRDCCKKAERKNFIG